MTSALPAPAGYAPAVLAVQWNRRLLVSAVVVSVLMVSVLMVVPGCSKLRHPFSGGGVKTRTGTLTVAPLSGPVGTAFTLTAGGFQPGEPMTFEVDVPGHPKFTGPPHTAGPDGTVTSTYTPLTGDPAGTYPLKADGSQGTHATGSLIVTG